jgi:hypothetical protein
MALVRGSAIGRYLVFDGSGYSGVTVVALQRTAFGCALGSK